MTIQTLRQTSKPLLRPILNSFWTVLGYPQTWPQELLQLSPAHVKNEAK